MRLTVILIAVCVFSSDDSYFTDYFALYFLFSIKMSLLHLSSLKQTMIRYIYSLLLFCCTVLWKSKKRLLLLYLSLVILDILIDPTPPIYVICWDIGFEVKRAIIVS